jgi:hypothetical protein
MKGKKTIISKTSNWIWVHKSTVFYVFFIFFLYRVFIYSLYSNLSTGLFGDIVRLKTGSMITDEFTTYKYPLLSVALVKILSEQTLIKLGPLTLISSYLLLYALVSKKIIYFFPLTILIPSYFWAFTPSHVDWLMTPIIYYLLKKNKNKYAIITSVFLIYTHGFVSLVYVLFVFILLGKIRPLKYVIVFALPQLLDTLVHLNEVEYIVGWSKPALYFFYPSVYLPSFIGLNEINFYAPVLFMRILTILMYLFTIFLITYPEKRQIDTKIAVRDSSA